MNQQSNLSSRARHALLHVDSASAEWFDRDAKGAVQYGCADVAGPSPEELAEAAEQALQFSGARRRSCVLALGPGFVEQRFLPLPSLPKAELRKVLHRKAASQLETTPADALFAAKEFGALAESRSDGAGAQAQWLLLAMRRSVVSPLRVALRARGINVKRVVFGRLAATGAAHAHLESASEGNIIIAVETEAVTVSLVADGTLLNQNVLQGNLAENAGMAAVLIQEVRSYEAFWRKQSRGEGVAGVAILGLGAERGESLCATVGVALPGAEVELILDQEDPHEGGRLQWLASCLVRSPLSLDLTVPLPARKLATAMILLAFVAITAGAGVVTLQKSSRNIESTETRIQSLERSSRDLDRTERELGEARQLRAQVDEAIGSLVKLKTSGASMSDSLGTVFGSFRSRAGLLSMSTSSSDTGGQVVISGVTDGNPLKAYSALELIRSELEESPHFMSVLCTPGARLPGTSSGGSKGSRGLEFKVEALQEGGQ